MNQAQLLGDTVYYPDTLDAQQWLVFYITRPLVGSFEAVSIVPASLTDSVSGGGREADMSKASNASASTASMPRKKDIKSFGDLLNNFPMIARQMQPGLERLFKQMAQELEKPLPAVPARRRSSASSSRPLSVASMESFPNSLHSSLSFGTSGQRSMIVLHEAEDLMRRSLETAVTGAIDLFQMVDKQQLSLLGATTDLTGPLVERMIERYVAEQVHDSVLFPSICAIRRLEDQELESQIRQMLNIDISQVGISIENGSHGKKELAARLAKGVGVFKTMGVAGSPQEMLDVLLAAQKVITSSESLAGGALERNPEKQGAMLTINADTLVSLLLVVVIRSSVRHLQARLSYMRHFIFIDDVESGEMGYALSTFEAVLSYLARDSGGLRRSSRRNRALWQATKMGDLAAMRTILEPTRSILGYNSVVDEPSELGDGIMPEHDQGRRSHSDLYSLDGVTLDGCSDGELLGQEPRDVDPDPQGGSLAHVFPFQRPPTPSSAEEFRPKVRKRVSMDTRSMSSSSGYSFRSRSDTVESRNSGAEGDISIEKISHTHGIGGDSVLMMAVENRQAKALQYLLDLTEYYPLDVVLEDCNNEGTNLLSEAVQLGDRETTDVLLDFILDRADNDDIVRDYLARPDKTGRCVAHYLFHQPQLIARLGRLVSWTLKDKLGQTPLFALCRSYDHSEYRWMVDAAISAATRAQEDRQPLHLDDHIDTKGNTLLHIINDPQMALRLLYQCDSDVNATNDKHFSPLMVASKFGRTDLVRTIFGDPRVDLYIREQRGFTAVELAKDDEVRNRIDDLVLLSRPPAADGRITTVVRSFFVDDGVVRLILKSGAPNPNSTITVTTCRRSLTDFENLAKWLGLELPASWLPSISDFQSPFLIPSKPARSLLRDIQTKLDSFLKILLSHSTFSTHEMVWEFFLVPDVDPMMLFERSIKKAEIRAEAVREEYEPVSDVREVEVFVAHARESVRSVHHSVKSVVRRVNRTRQARSDLHDAAKLASSALSTLTYLPESHVTAFTRYAKTLAQTEMSPLTGFYYNMHAISTTTSAILAALARPANLIGSIAATQKAVDRHTLSLRRNDRWPLGLLDDTRHRMQRDAGDKADRSRTELEVLGKELRYTQQTVAGELAAWQEERVRMGRRACREIASRMVVAERDRLEGMRRALRCLGAGPPRQDGPTTP